MIPVTDNELKPQMNERDKKVVRNTEVVNYGKEN